MRLLSPTTTLGALPSPTGLEGTDMGSTAMRSNVGRAESHGWGCRDGACGLRHGACTYKTQCEPAPRACQRTPRVRPASSVSGDRVRTTTATAHTSARTSLTSARAGVTCARFPARGSAHALNNPATASHVRRVRRAAAARARGRWGPLHAQQA